MCAINVSTGTVLGLGGTVRVVPRSTLLSREPLVYLFLLSELEHSLRIEEVSLSGATNSPRDTKLDISILTEAQYNLLLTFSEIWRLVRSNGVIEKYPPVYFIDLFRDRERSALELDLLVEFSGTIYV